MIIFLIGLVIGLALGATTLAVILALLARHTDVDIDWSNAARR